MNKYGLVAVLVAVLTLTGVYAGEDQRETLGVDYKVEGNLEAKEGHSFPKEWGQLVNYVHSTGGDGAWGTQSTGVKDVLVFEAEDGTIRMVAVDLNWKKFKIDDIKVLTIGRN